MAEQTLSREQIGERYFASLPYPPYPVQEEALLAWFLCEHGVLMCAPTGTGKTLVAQGAMFEALTLGKTAYYTTPLIALTEQKFHEMQEAAVRWGFSADDVGLVTGNRKVNPDAKILVVVAEILLNRLMNASAFRFEECSAVVMDEFHSFNDPERGIVWELSLGLLPRNVRLLLLSATVGNAPEFLVWLQRNHNHKLDLALGTERRVPLSYHWIADKLLGEQLAEMAQGDEAERKTPALVFCFNREECWSVGEQLKGLDLLGPEQRDPLRRQIEACDWSKGVGGKLRSMLWRGVGVHHAGMLPKYRRVVERLFLNKLLSVVVCTETLAAGLNLPARSVVLTALLKGPPGAKKLINASVAHQMFGRAGRPQFDSEGFVYALAHEDDVKIAKWEGKFRTFPESSKDPAVLKAKKAFLKKKPARRANEQYWTQAQFQKLIQSPPARLYSHGPLPWRLLAYLLESSPDVGRLRSFLAKRLLDPPRILKAERDLTAMLLTLHHGGYVVLSPAPPPKRDGDARRAEPPTSDPRGGGLFARAGLVPADPPPPKTKEAAAAADYAPETATPTPELAKLLAFRSIHPLYGAFLLDHLGYADDNERILGLESALNLPRPLLRSVRPPRPDELPPGPLETQRLDPLLIERGLARGRPAGSTEDESETEEDAEEERPPTLADKLRMLFDDLHPGVHDLSTQSIWAAGEILRFGGDFDKFVRTMKLVKQEGIVFRHVLRLVLLCGEFASLRPPGVDLDGWRGSLSEIARRLTISCRAVDAVSTARTLQQARADDFVGDDEATPGAPPVDRQWEAQWDSMLAELSSNDADSAKEEGALD